HLVERHVGEAAVAQDPGVGDHDVDRPEALDRRPDGPGGLLRIGHRPVVGHGFPSGGSDLLDHTIGGAGGRAGAVHGPSDVVDAPRGPRPGQLQGVGAAQSSSGAGDDGDSTVEVDRRQLLSPGSAEYPPRPSPVGPDVKTSEVCSPGAGIGPGGPAGVAENRGAGAGWITPSTSTKVPRSTRCGWRGASVIE